MKENKITLSASKYIRIYSDIHLDFDVTSKNFDFSMLWVPEALQTDKETTLILAGDLWHAKKPYDYDSQSWLKTLSEKFQYIIVVLGNHDFWGGNFPKEYDNYEKAFKEQNLNNVYLLQDNIIEIGNNKFIGGTLWTDYLDSNPIAMEMAENGPMKDYKFIKYGIAYQRIRAKHLLSAHIKTKNFIFTNAVKEFPEQKIWVITHHLPTIRSIPEEYLTDKRSKSMYENALYYSDLDAEIKKVQIDFWIHGHTHQFQEYFIGKTLIISNPRGYTGEDTLYNPWYLLELN